MKKRTKLLSVVSIVVFSLMMFAGTAFAQGPNEGPASRSAQSPGADCGRNCRCVEYDR